MTDLTMHKLVFVPHEALLTQVKTFPHNNASYRKEVAEHMITEMTTHRGVGLAANQINLDAAVFVQKIQGINTAIFNPVIHYASPKKVLMTEGCLSEPGLYMKLSRPDFVTVSWEDENDERTEATLYGLDCRIFLHEFDHTLGVLFTDRVNKVKLTMGRKKQQKILRKIYDG